MDTQNVTLAIPKEVLHKAKEIAVARRTSLSGLLTQLILDEVQHEVLYQNACDRQLALLERGLDFGTGGVADWTREDLHER